MPKTKKEFISLLAKRMNTDEATAKQWIEGYADTLIDIFKTGEVVTCAATAKPEKRTAGSSMVDGDFENGRSASRR